MITKYCKKCSRFLSVDEFYAHPATYDGLFGHCKDCERSRARIHQRKRRDADPLFAIKASLRSRFGMTLEDYDRLLEDQGGVCAICESGDNRSKGERFHIDHDHETGEVRGLLCGPCNTGIGGLNDDLDRLLDAVAYLLRPMREPAL